MTLAAPRRAARLRVRPQAACRRTRRDRSHDERSGLKAVVPMASLYILKSRE